MSAQTLNLTEEELAAFTEMAQEKVNHLGNSLRILCDKSQSKEMKEDAEKLALRQFIDDRQIVQTSSSTTGEVKSEQIGRYLYRLKTLPYKQVLVEWYDIRFTSELKKGTDGRYYATMTVFQKFTAIGPEGQVIYSDVTQKDIDIVVDMSVQRIGDREYERPEVKLGNISVVETR